MIQDLITQLSYIDSDAAAYVRSQWAARTCNDVHSLGKCFLWAETPQGHTYWRNLADQLANSPKRTKLGNEF
jgi:hypothetical protein